MIIVNYKSKRQLEKAIGKPLDCEKPLDFILLNFKSLFFVTNWDKTFEATVIIVNGKITSVR